MMSCKKISQKTWPSEEEEAAAQLELEAELN